MINHRYIYYIISCMSVLPCFALQVKKNYDAVRAFYKNDLPKAQQLFEELIAANADDFAAQYNAGKVLYAQQNFEKAEAYFNHAAKQDVDKELKVQSYFDCGNAQVKQKKWDEALQSYTDVLQLDSAHQKAREMINILEQHKKQQEKQKEKDKQGQDKKDHKKDSSKKENKEQSEESEKQDKESQESNQKQTEQEESNNQKKADGKQSGQKNDEKNAQSKNDDNQQTEQKEQQKNEGIPQADDKAQADIPGQSKGNVPKQNNRSSEREDDKSDQPDNQAKQQASNKSFEQNDQKHSNQQRKRNEECCDGSEGHQVNNARQNSENNKHAEAENQQVEHEQSPSGSEKNVTEKGYDKNKANMSKGQAQEAFSHDEKGLFHHINQNEPDARLSKEENMLLQAVENHDAQTTKILIKNNIKKGMPAQHGYKNW